MTDPDRPEPPASGSVVVIAPDGPWLTTADVARHYRKPDATIRYWRLRGYGPKGTKVGRDVLYAPAEVLRFDEELQALADAEAATA